MFATSTPHPGSEFYINNFDLDMLTDDFGLEPRNQFASQSKSQDGLFPDGDYVLSPSTSTYSSLSPSAPDYFASQRSTRSKSLVLQPSLDFSSQLVSHNMPTDEITTASPRLDAFCRDSARIKPIPYNATNARIQENEHWLITPPPERAVLYLESPINENSRSDCCKS